MGNNQLLPFERNRYYVGKLLTSADFQAEQTYGMHKRRFLNEMMFGSGIVCGLGVFSLDDLSIMVDSGMAVDGCGREIAVSDPVVRKLSAVDGFTDLQTERAALCLRYQEEDVHPVYTVRSQENGETYECNRIREAYQLFLMDAQDVESMRLPDPEFLSSAVLYEDEDYVVNCTMPAQCARGSQVRLEVAVRRLREEAQPLTLKAVLQIPAFSDGEGSHELPVELQAICPPVGQEQVEHLLLRSQNMPAPESVLLVEETTFQVSVGEESRPVSNKFALRTSVVEASAEEIVNQAVASASLELRSAAGGQDYVTLAEISLQRTRNSYMIEEIHTMGVRRYIETVGGAAQRRELSAWFGFQSREAGTQQMEQEPVTQEQRYTEPIYASGVCEIALGPNMKKGQVAYSDEVIHGLGAGNVYVTVGTEYLAEDAKLGEMARNTIYGDVSLFPNEQVSSPQAEMAVKVMNDRGSFVVAAKLLADSNQVVLPLRWVAMSLPAGGSETMLQQMAGKSIAAVQPTVVMATREVHYINVRFNNMEPCTLTYELTEKNSGEITSDGIYTAPGREGVFEIRISCAEYPLITTYAYVVVKKRDTMEEEASAT